MAGRKPKPDSLKIAAGTLRRCRVKKNPPKASGIPKCPFQRSTIAAAKWREVTAGLKRLGIVDKIDATHIEGLCHSYQVAKEADAVVRELGMLLPTKEGGLMKNPATTISGEAWHKVRMCCNDLGMTHLSRQRMESTKVPVEVGLEAKYLG